MPPELKLAPTPPQLNENKQNFDLLALNPNNFLIFSSSYSSYRLTCRVFFL